MVSFATMTKFKFAFLRFAVDTSDSYRAEIRSPTGVVKGIYR